MSAIFHQHYVGATFLVVFALSGCQIPSGKWSMGLKEREKANDQGSSTAQVLADRGASSSKGNRAGDQADELIKSGDALRKNKQHEEARVVYQRALALSPQSSDIHHRLAIIADKQKQYSVADKHYEAALKLQPNDVNLMSDLGYSYSLRGNSEKAEKILKKALAIDATHKGALANLGSIYAKQDRYSDAQALFRAGVNEAEAQQYLSQLFPDRVRPEVTAMTDRGRLGVKGLLPSLPPGNASDLSRVSVEELQAEVERRASAENTGRSSIGSQQEQEFDAESPAQTPQVAWDAQVDPPTEIADSDETPQGVTVPSEKIGQTSKPRKIDTNLQPARAQSGIASADLIPSAHSRVSANPRSSSQRATEFGLNAGPGNLFSIVPGIEMTDAINQTKMPPKQMESIDDSSKSDVAEGEAFEPVTEVGADWEQTVTRRPATIATADAPPAASATPQNGSGSAQPFQGLWPNSNQLPNSQSPESATNLRTSDRPEISKSIARSSSRITSKSSWSDTVVDKNSVKLDASQGKTKDAAASDDATDSWPYASQR